MNINLMHFINLESSLVKYDNAYFESSALLIIEVAKSSVSYKLKMSSVKIDDGTMVVKFNFRYPNTATYDMAYCNWVLSKRSG